MDLAAFLLVPFSCFLAISAIDLDEEVDILIQIGQDNRWKNIVVDYPFMVKLDVQQCEQEIQDNLHKVLGLVSYVAWTEKVKLDDGGVQKTHDGCTCKEIMKIFSVTRRTKAMDIENHLFYVYDAVCDGYGKDSDSVKFMRLFNRLENYESEHVMEFFQYGRFMAVEYLTNRKLDDKEWGIDFIMQQVVSRQDDILLFSSINFVRKMGLTKEMFNKMMEKSKDSQEPEKANFKAILLGVVANNERMMNFVKEDTDHFPEFIHNMSMIFGNGIKDKSVVDPVKDALSFIKGVFNTLIDCDLRLNYGKEILYLYSLAKRTPALTMEKLTALKLKIKGGGPKDQSKDGRASTNERSGSDTLEGNREAERNGGYKRQANNSQQDYRPLVRNNRNTNETREDGLSSNNPSRSKNYEEQQASRVIENTPRQNEGSHEDSSTEGAESQSSRRRGAAGNLNSPSGEGTDSNNSPRRRAPGYLNSPRREGTDSSIQRDQGDSQPGSRVIENSPNSGTQNSYNPTRGTRKDSYMTEGSGKDYSIRSNVNSRNSSPNTIKDVHGYFSSSKQSQSTSAPSVSPSFRKETPERIISNAPPSESTRNTSKENYNFKSSTDEEDDTD